MCATLTNAKAAVVKKDAGAPLEDAELDIMVDLYEKIKPYLTPASIAEIERKGKYVYHKEFGWVTPTLGGDNEICVYGTRDEKGIIKCAFEQAYYDGVIGWKKPISCHFFPIIQKTGRKGDYDRMNYEPRPTLCSPACSLGKKLKVPVYQFLKEPIIRKYGEDFYNALRKRPPNISSEKEINSTIADNHSGNQEFRINKI